jgi:hypothetical protein
MHILLSLIPFVVIFLITFFIVAGFVKLAARLLRRARVSWKHSFDFGAILAALVVAKYSSDVLFSSFLAPAIALTLGTIAALGTGAWFFSTRAGTEKGGLLGWRGGLLLTGITLVLSLAFNLALALLITALLAPPA